jgi:hypothetical protein
LDAQRSPFRSTHRHLDLKGKIPIGNHHSKIGRWLDVHEEELGLFLWTVALLFLVRSSGIFLNNYAEMAF